MTGGRLHVSGGWAVSQMIEGLQRGVHAFMPTSMHRIYAAIHHQRADHLIDQVLAMEAELEKDLVS